MNEVDYKIDFKELYEKGKKINGKYLVTYMKENNLNKIKPGVVASRKVGNAVTRNRIKRIIREAIIQINKDSQFNIDIVIISKHSNGKNKTLKTIDIIDDLLNIFKRRK